MNAILKFDFQTRKELCFSEVNYLNYTKKTNFAYDNYIFPKTRGNKNKQWTHIPGGVLDFGLDGGVPPRPRDPNPCLE